MRLLTLGVCAVALIPVAWPSPPARAQGDLIASYQADKQRCWEQVRAGEFKTIAQVTDCENSAMGSRLRAIGFPFMDLEMKNEAEKLVAAQRADLGMITADQAVFEMNASDLRMAEEINRRVDAYLRAGAATRPQIDLQALQVYRLMLGPAPALTTDCRTVLPGQWQCVTQ